MSSNDLAQYLDSLSRQDRYRIDATLKQSDFERTEVVYLQEESGLQRGPFVRKTIARDTGLGNAYERIFAQQQAGHSFTHIPHLHECYANESDLVVVMDYVPGETLQDLVYRSDPSLELVRSIFPQLCDAVTELHEAFDPPLIHRDLKPSNVMLANGVVYIIDFGIAREFKVQGQTDTMHFGTRAYAPPEQYGFGQTTVRSDIYALGMLLYYCLTEQTPDSQVAQEGFADPRIPEALRTVLKRATAFDPQDRFSSVRELKYAVEMALNQPDMILGTQGPFMQDGGVVRGPGFIPNSDTTPIPGATLNPGIAPDPSVMPDPSVTPADDKPVSLMGILYNVALVILAALVISVSIMIAFGYLPSRTSAPPWLDMFGYLFFIPVITIATTILLMYKRPFKKRFPRVFARFKTPHFIVAYLCLWGIFIVILGTMSTIAKG